MPENHRVARALHGLRARLELENGLGCQYLALSGRYRDVVQDVRKVLEQPGDAPSRTANVPIRRPVATTPAPLRTPVPASSSPEKFGERTAPPARPTPPGYVSLVPLRPAPANPEKDAALSELKDECSHCTACDLCAKRTNVAWGEGDLSARVMFIGEAPGRDEDIEGRPFVGRSGRLLTDIIEKGMKLPRSDVYITNVVKCRPPGNRDPRPDETAACARYLKRQIEVIRPEVIVAVGTVAGRNLLGQPEGAPGLRGRWHDYDGIPLRVVYHPSYLLRMRRHETDRTPADRQMWDDILEVMAKLNPAP